MLFLPAPSFFERAAGDIGQHECAWFYAAFFGGLPMKTSHRRHSLNRSSAMRAWAFPAMFLLVLSSLTYGGPSQAQGVPRDPYVVDSNGKVIGRFYVTYDPFEPYDPYDDPHYSEPDYVVFSLKPSGAIVRLGVTAQGFINIKSFTQFFATRDCSGDVYLEKTIEDSNLIRTAYINGTKIFYQDRGEAKKVFALSYNSGVGTACNPTDSNILAVPILSANLADQRFSPPFSFTLH